MNQAALSEKGLYFRDRRLSPEHREVTAQSACIGDHVGRLGRRWGGRRRRRHHGERRRAGEKSQIIGEVPEAGDEFADAARLTKIFMHPLLGVQSGRLLIIGLRTR